MILNHDLDPASICRKGITAIGRSDVIQAKGLNKSWKLVGCIEVMNDHTRAYVEPELLDISHPLAGVSGNLVALTLTTHLLGDITIIGPGAGKKEPGFAVLKGLLKINKTSQEY